MRCGSSYAQSDSLSTVVHSDTSSGNRDRSCLVSRQRNQTALLLLNACATRSCAASDEASRGPSQLFTRDIVSTEGHERRVASDSTAELRASSFDVRTFAGRIISAFAVDRVVLAAKVLTLAYQTLVLAHSSAPDQAIAELQMEPGFSNWRLATRSREWK